MHAKDLIQQSMAISDMLMTSYLKDLDDQALLLRPVAGMNPIAWQLGHLISAERGFIEAIKPGSCPPLPDGFAEAHGKDKGQAETPSGMRTKDEYVRLFQAQRAATKSVVESITDAELDAPAPQPYSNYVPTVGLALNLFAGMHDIMHLGQFVPVRRTAKLPVIF